jgi:glycosyltransferase involved in cell wall biosynthesis
MSQGMTRPIVFDVSHLAHRLRYSSPSGIEKVDFAYGRHFGLQPGKIVAGAQYRLAHPRVVAPAQVSALVRSVQSKWALDIDAANDAKFQQVRRWIVGEMRERPNLADRDTRLKEFVANYISRVKRDVLRSLPTRDLEIPDGAIYLNIAQHALETGVYFSWLSRRPDLQRVFFIHDLLPLQHPEFWPADHLQLFRRRIACVAEHASAIITTSRSVETALREEMTRLGRADISIFASHFPSPLALSGVIVEPDATLANANYFVAVNTIEPRKNHLLLIDVWRELARAGASAPKLVLIGKRGWKFDEITRSIEKDAGLRSLIIEAAGLSDAGLQTLLTGAKALLAPSFAEGYGLPIVEALTLRTPVIASDIPVFREVSQQRAIFRDPNDVLGWLEAISALSEPASTLSRQARDAANAYVPPSGETYFAAVEAFLAML